VRPVNREVDRFFAYHFHCVPVEFAQPRPVIVFFRAEPGVNRAPCGLRITVGERLGCSRLLELQTLIPRREWWRR
jgi:hypothetical protein